MGGAKNCPETPRQKMIGMMYLVLTAMLALNVSTDILSGFTLVDNSLHESTKTSEDRNALMMESFRAAAETNPDKNLSWYEKACGLRDKSDSLYAYIDNFKYNIVRLADGKNADPEARNIVGKSNLDVTGQYGIVEGNGAILKEKIHEYRDYLIALSDSTKTQEFNTLFATNEGKTNDGQPISWEATLFEGMPVGASVTLLTKIQSDIRTAQGRMIQYLQMATDASDLRVNKMEALVIPKSSYVIKGQKYSAQIVLAAVDTTQKPTYFINGARISDNGLYEFTANTLGTHQYTGQIVVRGGDGTETPYPFRSEYSVGEPSVTISNDDLDAVYRGYKHTFSISVPGMSNDKIYVKVDNGKITKKGNIWLIDAPTNASTMKVSVFADVNGTNQFMGDQSYRVLPLPEPAASIKVGDKEYSSEIGNSVINNPKATVVAGYGSDVLIDLGYTVTAFTLRVKGRVIPSSSNKFTEDQRRQLSKLKRGDDISIVDIHVVTETGLKKKLERGVAITIK